MGDTDKIVWAIAAVGAGLAWLLSAILKAINNLTDEYVRRSERSPYNQD